MSRFSGSTHAARTRSGPFVEARGTQASFAGCEPTTVSVWNFMFQTTW